MEKRIVGEKGGPSGPFHSVVSDKGRVVAMQIIERNDAEMIAMIPEMLRDINHLVFVVIQDKRPLKMDQEEAQKINEKYAKYRIWLERLCRMMK